METLSWLRPAFRPDGTISAGNAPGLNSGAAAMRLAGECFLKSHGIATIARLVAYGVGAVARGFLAQAHSGVILTT